MAFFMAFPFNDQVYTKSFTPREYQVELLYAAKQRNIIVCLGKNIDRAFIVSKLIQEYATGNRRPPKDGGKRTLYLLDDEETCAAKANFIRQLTDLSVAVLTETSNVSEEDFTNVGVIASTADAFWKFLTLGAVSPSLFDLVIVDRCHAPRSRDPLERALATLSKVERAPRVVALAAPLFDLTGEAGRLSLETERLENAYGCRIETASDILSVLRYGPKPREYVIEYEEPAVMTTLEERLESCALHAVNFLQDHRYDPSEIYNDEFLEDIQKIPDPTEKPREMMEDFLRVLRSLGSWCADRAALALLILAEKLKVKTPYERHYLLLNMVSSVMTKIRALCDEAFEPLTERERIIRHSRPMVHRLLAILRTYRPTREPGAPPVTSPTTSPPEIQRPGCSNGTTILKASRRGGTRGLTKLMKQTARHHHRGITDPELLCGIVFVDESLTAKILFHLLNEVSRCDEDLRFLSPLYAVERTNDETPTAGCSAGGVSTNARHLEAEHRKQEEVLKRFRIHECNLLIATSILEQGIEIPKCNFVMRYHFPDNYQSYVQCKSRARAVDALHVLLVPADRSNECVRRLARYHYVEKILLEKCWNEEPSEEEETEADAYAPYFPRYRPLESEDAPGVTFNSAISLVNRYCAKLPSDTFTRLTPEWTIEMLKDVDSNVEMYTCSLRLPVNSPLKYAISSHPMPNRAMARRCAALRLCVRLHKENEIDDNLSPIGKENFRARPEDAEVSALPDESRIEHSEARPGTTKRRQYYYKKTAEALTDCRPVVGAPAYLYHIDMSLSCPLPEEQNTRGRRIYPPEESAIGFGILTLKPIPKLCPFPIYTRSGEVRVELRLCGNTVILNAARIERIATFLNYTFTNVLRLQKYLMLFDPNASENSYTIVPVKTAIGDNESVSVDWDFLERIYDNRETIPREVPQDERTHFTFDPSKYHDAVIMPWYRNQDQPQYFYVAEICANLDPTSAFPGDGYSTFEEYYLKKYNIRIQNRRQPLLDVDHTSARLNFLTPRYVNRKGVALPTSSEETKRAKRENLEQKQILVAELCAIHPFPASLWRQAVCLPCILYRINALLLADQIRCEVARAINLGKQNLDAEFQWPPLNFGWSLAEVLDRSRQTEKSNQDEEEKKKKESKTVARCPDVADSRSEERHVDDVAAPEDELEIGTWSNDMAVETLGGDLGTSGRAANEWWGEARYGGSPTYDSDETCSDVGVVDYSDDDDDDDDDTYLDKEDDYDDDEDDSDEENRRGLRISYMGENIAEAVEDETRATKREMSKKILHLLQVERESEGLPCWPESPDVDEKLVSRHKHLQRDFTESREAEIVNGGSLVTRDRNVDLERRRNVAIAPGNVLDNPADVDEKRHLAHGEYVERIAGILLTEMKRDAEESRSTFEHEITRLPVQESSGAIYSVDERLSSFDEQPELRGHPGPSPSLILQALTMSNANDGINLERLETIGDSFLKYAITTYLYCTYDRIHEGKLSHLRSKQVSNLNLYRLGRRKMLGESMIATKFEPHDNWLPPCYYVPKELEQALIESGVPSTLWNRADMPSLRSLVDPSDITQLVRETEQKLGMMRSELLQPSTTPSPVPTTLSSEGKTSTSEQHLRCFIPYNLITQHSIPDKSIADCVEALIGAYLIACGPRGALLFMAWLGINVLPSSEEVFGVADEKGAERREDDPGVTPWVEKRNPETGETTTSRIRYGKLEEPRNPLSKHAPNPLEELAQMLDGYDRLQTAIGYEFRDPSYLLQAFTHASYQPNRLTDCYQRLEFLGDAVLDYLITRHLYEDARQHSPGALTDLRSALVNNTIFASLAVRCGFHKYFRHLSPGLNVVIDRFVRIQEENGHSISEEYYLMGEEDREEAEDVEVPKALGDVFESLAGAIYLDSGMSLDAVWAVYYRIMKTEIEQFSTNVPKSPIRELLELEPETAKFGKPEKLADGRRVRVTVDVFGKGSFKGIGRNYRIAKCTAAKCALKKLKRSHATRRAKL